MSGETWMRNRWLHVFFAGTMLLTVAITVFGWSPWSIRWPAYVTVAVLVVAYLLVGHRGYDDARAARVFLPLVIIAAFVLPAMVPSAAFLQCIVFPLVWVQSERIRTGVLLSVAVGLASGAGLMVSGGPDSLVSTLLIEGISIIGACALGIWISSVAGLSEERRQLVEELRATQDSLAEAHRSAGVTSERERFAREIHDTVAQNLAGIVMLTERARGDLAADRVDRLDERLTILEESARAALEESRTLVAAGAAGVAGDGLGAALHRLGERISRESDVVVSVDAADCALDRDTQVVLLRVAQEALANVRAHAHAASADVALHVATDRVGLRITDDGVGFDPSVPTAGHGLRGLRDRLALAGGTCTITSDAGRGTVVEVSLPTGAEPRLPSDASHPVAAVTR